MIEITAPLLMNIATLLFFISSFPQMVTSYRRRKKGLRDFNIKTWIICWIGCVTMGVVGYLIGAWLTVIIESWHTFYHAGTLYWIFKYRKRKHKSKKKQKKQTKKKSKNKSDEWIRLP